MHSLLPIREALSPRLVYDPPSATVVPSEAPYGRNRAACAPAIRTRGAPDFRVRGRQRPPRVRATRRHDRSIIGSGGGLRRAGLLGLAARRTEPHALPACGSGGDEKRRRR